MQNSLCTGQEVRNKSCTTVTVKHFCLEEVHDYLVRVCSRFIIVHLSLFYYVLYLFERFYKWSLKSFVCRWSLKPALTFFKHTFILKTAGLPLPAFQTDTPTAVGKHGDVTAQGALKRQHLNIRTNWRIQQRLFYIVLCLLHVFIMLFVFMNFIIFSFLCVCVWDLLWCCVDMSVPCSATKQRRKTTTDNTAS